MELSRRDFITLLGAGTGAALVSSVVGAEEVMADSATGESTSGKKGVLYDSNLCVGCRACQDACKQWNKMPPDPQGYGEIYDNPWNLSSKTLTLIKYTEVEVNGHKEPVFCKYQCMHCEHPACVTVCPVGALQKTPSGPVTYDDKKCFGCRYCMVACPFGVPTFQWDRALPWIRKCTFCADRQEQGLRPACVAACPAGALKFGEREELIIEARERIAAAPDKYINHIYGEKEVGGTSWLLLSRVPFEELGYPPFGPNPVSVNAERAMGAVAPVLLGVAAAMTGIYWLTKSRQKAAKKEAGKEKKQNEVAK
jgi:formate dehydrogenase iron-sulfur subunit